MLKRGVTLVCLSVFLLSQSAMAESTDYHLKRLEIQARAFLAGLEPPSPPAGPTLAPEQPPEGSLDASTSVNGQLQATAEAPTWAESMVIEDIHSLLSTSEALRQELKDADSDDYQQAKVELESLARRLRISTSPLRLDPQQTTNLQLMMLELEEATAAMTAAREQLMARQDARRRDNNRISVGVGLGVGYPYGNWGPWGYGGWGVGGWGSPFYGGFYRPYPARVYRNRICR